ncbi:MAG: FecR domain-containing protein [Hyphomicrobiales bacterium]|nr:FecR domain-containing protein [Hyphomicrobiales bacterium]
MRTLRSTIVLLFILALPLCDNHRVAAQEWLYTVRPGDNLWDLSETYLRSVAHWKRLQQLNGVSDPHHLPPGTRLRVPIAWLKLQPVPVEVVTAQGQVETTQAGSAAPQPLQAGMRLNTGAVVRTYDDSSAILLFADGSRMLLASNSELHLDALSVLEGTPFTDSRVRLMRGRSDIRARSGAQGQSWYSISTPAAITAVRGTEFRVGVQDQGKGARTEVLEGQVNVSAGARTQPIKRGFGTVVRKGSAPMPPRPLLPAPDLHSVPAELDRLPVRFKIKPLTEAVAYRLEVANDSTFEPLLFDNVFSSVEFVVPDLPDGQYTIRVRGIDASSLEGFDATTTLTVDARPEPPILMDPIEDAFIPDGVPNFRWTKPEDAQSYHLQITRGDDFTQAIVNKTDQTRASFSLDAALSPGVYSWRIATVDDLGEEGPFSDPENFRVPEPGPGLQPPDVSGDKMVFRTREGQPGQRYRFQISDDEKFDNKIIDTVVSEPRLEIDTLPYGVYYIRVRMIEPSGLEGTFGSTQRIDIEPDTYWTLLTPLLGLLLLLAVL